jgi:hypothetical protein
MTQLVQGKIPANTVCPYRSECHYAARDWCAHKGEAHSVPFSCGLARAFALVQRNGAQNG